MPTDSAVDRRVGVVAKARCAPATGSSDSPADPAVEARRGLSEEEAAARWDAVELKRFEFETAEGTAQTEDFAFNLRVGKTAFRRKGDASDCWRATFCADLGQHFVMRYRVPLSFDCHFSVHTDHEAAVLCHAWCHRTQHFCGLWKALPIHGGEDLFAQADLVFLQGTRLFALRACVFR